MNCRLAAYNSMAVGAVKLCFYKIAGFKFFVCANLLFINFSTGGQVVEPTPICFFPVLDGVGRIGAYEVDGEISPCIVAQWG